MSKFGYARVSSKEQNLDRQLQLDQSIEKIESHLKILEKLILEQRM